MAFRHRPKYDDAVPQRLIKARQAYDKEMAQHDEKIRETRREWSQELARAVESGMSYEEIVKMVSVSHSSVARAIRELRKSEPKAR